MDAKRISELRVLAEEAKACAPGHSPSKEEWRIVDMCLEAVPELVDEIERLQKLCDDYYRQCHKCAGHVCRWDERY